MYYINVYLLKQIYKINTKFSFIQEPIKINIGCSVIVYYIYLSVGGRT